MSRNLARRDDTPLSWKLEAIGEAVGVVVSVPFIVVSMAVIGVVKGPWWIASKIAHRAALRRIERNELARAEAIRR